jgi:hypothetical protein
MTAYPSVKAKRRDSIIFAVVVVAVAVKILVLWGFLF